MPNLRATSAPDSLVRFATATISTPGTSRSFGMCTSRVLVPAPTIPTLTPSAFIDGLPVRQSQRGDAIDGERSAALVVVVDVQEHVVPALQHAPHHGRHAAQLRVA